MYLRPDWPAMVDDILVIKWQTGRLKAIKEENGRIRKQSMVRDQGRFAKIKACRAYASSGARFYFCPDLVI
jgi:hypothetical protein